MAGGAPVSDCVQAGTEGWCRPSDFPKDNSTKSESSPAVWRNITGHERQSRAASVVGVATRLCVVKDKKVMATAGVNLTPALFFPAGCCQWSCRTDRSRCGCEWWWGTSRWTRRHRGTAPWAATRIPATDRWQAIPPWDLPPGGCIWEMSHQLEPKHWNHACYCMKVPV